MTRSVGSTQHVLSFALLAWAATVGQPAAAQTNQTASANTNSTGVETVVVTARKRSENIQTVPQTVTAIDAETIVNSHLTSVEDLSSFATNLDIVERADNTPDVTMRGVGTFGVIQGVGFYVNDVQQFEGQTVRPIDIDSIEILKGPQGTLYGGASTGGAIKYITKLPTDELTAEGTVEYGQQNTFTLEGAVSGPIVDDQLLARVSAFWSQDNGFIFDPTLNKTLTGPDEKGGRVTLEYLAGPTTILLYLSADRTQSESMNLYYAPPNDHTYLDTVLDGFVPHFVRELYSPTLVIDHEFDGATLTFISSYFHSFNKSDGDLNKLPSPNIDYLQTFNKNVWSEELRLASSGDSAVKWLIGAFAEGVDSFTTQQQVVEPAIIELQTDAYHQAEKNLAVFGNATYDIDQWSLEAGLRVAYYDNKLTDTTASLVLVPTLLGTTTIGPVCGPCSGALNRVEVMPMGSVSYHFTEDDMGYFTVARGFEPADFNDEPLGNNDTTDFVCIVAGPCQTNVVHDYKPEYVLSYELGVKSTLLDNRLRLNGDIFYINYDNRLFEVGKFVGGGLYTFEENLGSSHNYGLELDAEYVPIDELTLSAGLGFTRAIFDKGASDNINGTVYNLQGFTAPDTPGYQATLAVDWHHPLTDDLTLGARVGARLFGRSFWDGLDRFQQNPYQVIDAGLWLDIGDHWVVAAHVKNLFNAKYNTFYVDQSESGAPFNVASIGAPQQAFVSVTARY